jgi:hypothetical protein
MVVDAVVSQDYVDSRQLCHALSPHMLHWDLTYL